MPISRDEEVVSQHDEQLEESSSIDDPLIIRDFDIQEQDASSYDFGDEEIILRNTRRARVSQAQRTTVVRFTPRRTTYEEEETSILDKRSNIELEQEYEKL